MNGLEVLELVQASGLDLSEEAQLALSTIEPEHVEEFLEGVAKKVQIGAVGNPSNYICAAIKRGYTSNESYFGQKGETGKGCGKSRSGKGAVGGGMTSTDVNLALQKVNLAGVELTDEAIIALGNVAPEHAVEILEHVAFKAAELRDPSNYVAATIARGYQPRGEKGGHGESWSSSALSPWTSSQSWPSRSQETRWSSTAGGGATSLRSLTAPSTATHYTPRPPAMLPADITPLEQALVDLNCEGLWEDQQFDVNTLLMLRCIPEDAAMDLVISFGNKARAMKGKGKGISSINNYIQSATVKISRGDGPPGGGGGLHWRDGYQDGFDGRRSLNGGEPLLKRRRWES